MLRYAPVQPLTDCQFLTLRGLSAGGIIAISYRASNTLGLTPRLVGRKIDEGADLEATLWGRTAAGAGPVLQQKNDGTIHVKTGLESWQFAITDYFRNPSYDKLVDGTFADFGHAPLRISVATLTARVATMSPPNEKSRERLGTQIQSETLKVNILGTPRHHKETVGIAQNRTQNRVPQGVLVRSRLGAPFSRPQASAADRP
jgi:hypothetical protein